MVWNNTSGGIAVCNITVVAVLVVVGHGVVAISIWCAVWVVVGGGTLGFVPAAVCVAGIVDVWNNSRGDIAVCDITVVTVLVVVGHGVVAISVWSAVWVVVATSIGSFVPAAICVAGIVDVRNNTSGCIAICDIAVVTVLVVVCHGVVAIPVWSAVWVFVATSIGSGGIGSTTASMGTGSGIIGSTIISGMVSSGRVSIVPACPLVAMVVVDPVFRCIRTLATIVTAWITNVVQVMELARIGGRWVTTGSITIITFCIVLTSNIWSSSIRRCSIVPACPLVAVVVVYPVFISG